MTYVDGFVIPVPAGNEAAYRKQAEAAAPIFLDLGAIQVVENWEDDVPDGKTTDFRRAVNAESGEKIVFSWIIYPDKETRDGANAKMMDDPRFAALGEMPFDGKRMIFAGFSNILDRKE
jgi:uncharacterized protein YbaA (DUF1428 family)